MIRLLPLVILLGGCTTSDYEMRIFIDRESDLASGYIVEDGVKHNFEIQFVEKND